ncbi:hypothetical protein VCHA48O428_300015 [Vibrio chagasii]|nr:hypothetical protein VCHA48O428_300015 [Vibrio chagasii]
MALFFTEGSRIYQNVLDEIKGKKDLKFIIFTSFIELWDINNLRI